MKQPTPAQAKALRRIYTAGGATLDREGRGLIGSSLDRVDPRTINALLRDLLIEQGDTGRLTLTPLGLQAIQEMHS